MIVYICVNLVLLEGCFKYFFVYIWDCFFNDVYCLYGKGWLLRRVEFLIKFLSDKYLIFFYFVNVKLCK